MLGTILFICSISASDFLRSPSALRIAPRYSLALLQKAAAENFDNVIQPKENKLDNELEEIIQILMPLGLIYNNSVERKYNTLEEDICSHES
jgi:hypothetical protein